MTRVAKKKSVYAGTCL